MKSKVLKIGTVLLLFVCLISLVSIPASAYSYKSNLGYNNLYVVGLGTFYNKTLNKTYTTVSSSDTGTTDKYFDNSVIIQSAYSSSIVSSKYESCEWQVWIDPTAIGHYSFIFAINGAGWFADGCYLDGNSVANNISNLTYKNLSSVTVNSVTFQRIKVDFDVNSLDKTDFGLTGDYFTFKIRSNTTSALGLTARIYDFTYSNDTDKVINNQNENTDKITNGWGGADSVDDGTADNFANAEDAALGGKSDEEIQTEINNALNFDIGVFDTVKVGKIHSLFDNVLNVTGSWQSLFVLSLTLGLGAFLIGRRYG